jgi:hypothetical protein
MLLFEENDWISDTEVYRAEKIHASVSWDMAPQPCKRLSIFVPRRWMAYVPQKRR